MITREFKLYLNAGTNIAPVINANQFDQDEEWIFTLLQEDGTVYTPSTSAIIGLKTDGTTILNAGTVNSSGQVVITETEQMTAVPGSNIFELLIDGNSHGTANFVVFVERRPGDIDNPSESDISLFQEAIDAAGNIEQFQADISALQSGLATTNANLTSEANTRASADATLQSAISTEASTRSTQDAVLQAEIDQIIAPTGEAPSAAEVQNARIGVDGTTYDTLGNAIRGQVSDLKNAINTVEDEVFGEYDWNFVSDGARASNSDVNYWKFNSTQSSLVKNKKYKISFTPNQTFTQDAIQVGTSNASASMVATLGSNINFVSETDVDFEYTPSVDDVKFIRIYGNADKISSVKVYEYARVGGLDKDVDELQDDVDELQDDVDELQENVKENTEAINSHEDGWEYYRSGERVGLSNTSYWRIISGAVALTKDVHYLLKITPNATFTLESVKVGTSVSASDMVATLGTNVTFVSGTAVNFEYTPSVDGVKYLRIYENAANISSLEVYTAKISEGISEKCERNSLENDTIAIQRMNDVYSKLNLLKSNVDASVNSLLMIRNGSEQTEKTITLSSVGVKKKYIVPIRMHYESSRFNPLENDVFFDKTCNTDFSDVRFFDSNGKMLKAKLGEPVNLDFLTDNLIYAFPKLFPLSNGYCIASFGGFGKGIYLSRSQCHGWGDPISGTSDVATSHPSDVNGYVSMFVVGVDSSDNVYACAGGKLYKCIAGADYSYETKTEVLDFSWIDTTDNNTVIYPDIQPNAFAIDGDGRMYIGLYQKQFRACVYVSSDGGDTWVQKYVTNIGPSASNFHQHVHQIVYDQYGDKVYVDIDDGNSTYNGGFILTTTDGGDTWTDITESISGSQHVRGKDYYPCYCGNGYRLGSGETYILGGACTIRSEDDINFDHVIKGFSATRSIVDFGDDSILIAGTQATTNSSENQILVSYDKGKTWKTVSRIDQTPINSGGGAGYRFNLSATQFAGESEPCCVLTNSESALNLKRTRVYKGGEHYYREAYVLLENIPSGDIVIIAKTGYSVEYPYQSIEGLDVTGLIYRIPFDEGSGRKVHDSKGNVFNLTQNAKWEINDIPVRYGEFGGDNRSKPFDYFSACKIENGEVNFGKIPELNFNKNYTVTFWLNEKARLSNYSQSNRLDQPYAGATAENKLYKLMSFGESDLVRYNNLIGLIPAGETDMTNATSCTFASALPFCDDYAFIAIEVGNGTISVSVNGSRLNVSTINNNGRLNSSNLSSMNFVIGAEGYDTVGFIGNICVYNKLLTNTEIIDIYKGFEF